MRAWRTVPDCTHRGKPTNDGLPEDKTRGLLAVREVAERGGGEFFDRVDAMFALWDMQMREHEVPRRAF